MSNKIKNIGVILGGTSTERDISLKSGCAVYESLLSNPKYKPFKIDPKDGNLFEDIKKYNIDFAFIALHGPGGEDGTIQGFLEKLNIPYSGNNVLGCALSINKIIAQSILRDNGICVPNFTFLSKKFYENHSFEEVKDAIFKVVSYPLMVKAPSQGSTLGIYYIDGLEADFDVQLKEALKGAFLLEDKIMFEEMITDCKEITVSVIGNEDVMSLPVIEITTTTGKFDYESKYTEGMCSHLIPANIDLDIRQRSREIAESVYGIFNLRGFTRMDFLIKDKELYLIDINTIPGLTSMSIFPDSAKYIGITFDMLIDYIIDMGMGIEFPVNEYLEKSLEENL